MPVLRGGIQRRRVHNIVRPRHIEAHAHVSEWASVRGAEEGEKTARAAALRHMQLWTDAQCPAIRRNV
jgi:hypothetical protein